MHLRKNQPGFSSVEIILIIVVVSLLGVAGWLVFDRQKKDDNTSPQSSAITSFDACVAAGNPVMESYPEQCSANGKTFTNASPKDSLSYLNERVDSGKKAFSITFPDGWGTIIKDTQGDFFIIRGEKQPVITQGAKPTIQNTEAHGGDGPTVFAIFIEDKNDYKPKGEPSAFGIGKGDTLLNGTKYSYTWEKDDEPGYLDSRLKNDRMYEYVFDLPSGKRLRAWYNVYGSSPANNVAVVEQVLQTITVN